MNILFVARKKSDDVGGLSRFIYELTQRFPHPHSLLTIHSSSSYLSIPWQKIDLIHLTDATLFPIGVLIKSILHKPLTVTAHGLDLCFPPLWYQTMLRFYSPKAHAFILDSAPVKKLVKDLPIRINKIYIINPGIAIHHLKPLSFKLPKTARKIRLVTVGNLVSRKGHCWFIDKVFRHLSDDFVYFIVGRGPELSKIAQLIKKYNLSNHIFLLGSINHRHLGYLLRQSDIYVCPNQRNHGNFEGFGIACGEASALGLPVVASEVDGLPEIIINKKNGLLVRPKAADFIRALNRLKNKKLRIMIGKKAESFTRNYFSWNNTINAYINVFQEVIDKT